MPSPYASLLEFFNQGQEHAKVDGEGGVPMQTMGKEKVGEMKSTCAFAAVARAHSLHHDRWHLIGFEANFKRGGNIMATRCHGGHPMWRRLAVLGLNIISPQQRLDLKVQVRSSGQWE